MIALRTKRYIGGYRVIAPIGAGGFATVYRAIDEETRREVAIKVLAENHSLVSETRRRFLAEIELLRTVDSQSIARVYEVGETDTGQPYMVLELANRGDLRRRLEEIRGGHQVLSRAELALLAHHLYESLTTLHRAEIVHRDVSPGNILIRSHRTATGVYRTGDGSVPLLEPGERFLLADLGHAKDMIRASGFTAGGGTRGFTSPEQRDDITVVDLRADIFSATAVIEWAAHDGVHAEDLEPFFDVGLAEDPNDRFTSMTEWHSAFSAALGAGVDSSNRRGLGLKPLIGIVGRGAKTAKAKSAVVAAVALACAGLVTLLLSNGDTDDTPGGRTSVAGITATADGDPLLNDRLQSSELLVVEDADPDPLPPLSVAEQSADDPVGLPSNPSEPTSPTTSEPPTTVTQSTTPQTTVKEVPDNEVEDPIAEIDQPFHNEVISLSQLQDDGLTISGNAVTSVPEGRIRLLVANRTNRQYWDDAAEQFGEERVQFDVAVEPGEDGGFAGTWEYKIPAELMEPGGYLVRVWAEGPVDTFTSGSLAHSVMILP